MAKEKQPRTPAAKRTIKKKSDQTNPNVPLTEEPASTAESASTATSRNAVIEGNATIDIDEVRRRAYELYEQEGRPPGKEAEHWYRAEQEVRDRNSKKSGRTEKSESEDEGRQKSA